MVLKEDYEFQDGREFLNFTTEAEDRDDEMRSEIKSIFGKDLHSVDFLEFEITAKNELYCKSQNYKIGSFIYECVFVQEEQNEPCLYGFEMKF